MSSRHRSDRGFTLIETLVTVVLIGLIATVLGATFSVIVRTTPVTEDRADDARSLLGLTNWLPLDVGSAAEAGFTKGDNPTGCLASSVPASRGLLELRWSSGQYPSGTVYVSNYRFVDNGPNTGTIYRYSCLLGGAAEALKMTAPLQKLAVGPTEAPAPVNITLEPATSGNPGHRGLEFEVIVLDDDGVTQRELISLDAFTANVFTTLPPTTTTIAPSTTTLPNNAPIAYDMEITVKLDDPFTFEVPAVDPDGDGIAVSFENHDPELNGTSAFADRFVTIEANTGLGAADLTTYSFWYRVDDTEPLTSNLGTVLVHVDDSVVAPSTSTSTTTTTTAPACVAAFDSPATDPTMIDLKPNGTMQEHLDINITTNGYCTPLVVTFDPMPNDGNMTPESIAFGAATTVTIDKNAFNWDDVETSFAFDLRQGANGIPIDTINVGVSP